MSVDLKKPQLRTLSYWLVDGVSELFYRCFLSFGSDCLLYSGVNAWISFEQDFRHSLCYFGLWWGIRRPVDNTVNERTTYPRTGYLAYNSTWKNKREVAIASGLTALLLGF